MLNITSHPNNPETGAPTPAPAVTHKVTADITNVAGAEIKGQELLKIMVMLPFLGRFLKVMKLHL